MKLNKFLAVVLFAPTMAHSQSLGTMAVVCGPTQRVIDTLITEYNEKMKWIGVEDDDVVVSTWENSTTGTFTIIKTSKSTATSCVISSGKIPDKT